MKFRMLLTVLCVFAIVLPALAQGIDGKWEAKQTTQRGETVITITLKNAGGTVTGTVQNGAQGMPVDIKAGKLDGMKLTFETSQAGRGGGDPVTTKWTGTVAGDSIKFTREGGRGGAQEIEAKRVK